MKILVLNCGSSSIKYKLYDMANEAVLAQGGVERIGLDEAFIKVKLNNGEKKQIMRDLPTHKEGVALVFECLLDPEIGAIKSLDEIDAVGHRVVQGGDLFEKSCIVTPEVEKGIESLIDLAPVHNKGHLAGIRAVNELMPNTPQVTVFDNAFHSTMPDYAYLYAIPYDLYKKYHVRRYGFHGTSHRYVSQRVCEMLGVDINTQKIITCHIGNGASVAAIKNGKVIDTSMGLTPLAGLMMGSRCGDIDPSAVTYLMEKLNKTPQEVESPTDVWLYLLKHAGTGEELPNFGSRIVDEALDRIRIDNLDDATLQTLEKDMIAQEEIDCRLAGARIETRLEMVDAMLARNYSDDEISLISGLSKEEIAKRRTAR